MADLETPLPLDCEYGVGTEAVRLDMDGTVTGGFTHWLCSWADTPSGVAALTGAPRWMQRNALAGNLMSDGDCAGCPAFKVKDLA